MQSEMPAERAPPPGRGEDPGRRAGAAPASQRLREDERPGAGMPGADLPEDERFFRATFDRAAIGIAHVSPEGSLLRVNRRLCDFLGYGREELAALTWQDLTHPDDLDADLAHVRRLLAGELDEYELDKHYVRRDGAIVWGHLTVALVRTPAGAPDYFISMVQDITARKRLEHERARLLARERTAHREAEATRAEAEATNAQLRALQALTDTALSPLALDDLLRELLGRVVAVLGVDHVCIFLLDEDGRTLTLRAARGLLEEYVGRARVPVGQGLAGRGAARRAPLIVDALSAADLEEAPPILGERLHSAVCVPLLVADHMAKGQPVSWLVGVVIVGSAAPRRFAAADVPLLQRVADRVALAVDRARLYAAEQDARRRAEAALARAQASEAEAAARAARLGAILETMADGVAVYDTEGRPVELVNRAYRELYALERAPARYEALPIRERVRLLDVRDTATGAPLPFERMPVGRAFRGEVVTGPGADVRMRAFDGRELEANASAAPLRDGDGRVVGAVVVLRDVTERNRLEREREAARADELAAREVSRRLEQFLAVAAHDLRAPLTAVVGFLDLAERQTERLATAAREACPALARRVESVRERVEEADRGAERLARLLTLLFDTAAIRADKLELRRAPHDLAALVREHVEGQHAAAPERLIRLHLPQEGAAVPVEVDADRIGQVVANYLTNALKYSPPDRPVDVSVAVRAEGGEGQARVARVAVRDRGPGLPEAERARVWELFHRASGVEAQSAARGRPGAGSLGLGLYISKAIVEAHGGRVGVEGAVGEGSTFWFTLPLAGPLSRPAGAAP